MSDTPGSRLQIARINAGYRHAADACEAFGWTYTTYAGHENDSRGYSRVAPKYARAYKVNLEWLITGRGDMKAAGTEDNVSQKFAKLKASDQDHVLSLIDLLLQREGTSD